MSETEQQGQTLVEHLTELRFRLIRSLIIIFIGTLVAWGFSHDLFRIIKAPIVPFLGEGNSLVFTGVMDDFMAHIKISIWCGLIGTCPLWLYQVWKFVAPGLYANEKRYTLGFIVSGSLLFIMGVAFAYFIVYPMAFKFLLHFSDNKPMITISEYLSFFFTTSLLFGTSFELPLVMTILGMLGVVSRRFLSEKRRYAIVSLSVVSAVVAPPDLLSMVLLLVPLVVLYEVGVILVGIFEPKTPAA